MNGPLSPQAHSRLYLHAVLPCLADLAEYDAAAHQIVAHWPKTRLALRAAGGPGTVLEVEQGRLAVAPEWGGGQRIDLLFLGEGHLNKFFGNRTKVPPLPVWGAHRVPRMIGFVRLLMRLQEVMDAKPEALAEPVLRRLFTRMTLRTAVLGLQPLAEFDGPVRAVLQTLPPGLAEFAIAGEEEVSAWFDHRPGQWAAGWGKPPRRPDVRVVFADTDVAFAALRDEADTLAEVGGRRIVVEGLVPLADGLNLVMERLRDYLQP